MTSRSFRSTNTSSHLRASPLSVASVPPCTGRREPVSGPRGDGALVLKWLRRLLTRAGTNVEGGASRYGPSVVQIVRVLHHPMA